MPNQQNLFESAALSTAGSAVVIGVVIAVVGVFLIVFCAFFFSWFLSENELISDAKAMFKNVSVLLKKMIDGELDITNKVGQPRNATET